MLNELLVNIYKHGFQGVEQGDVEIDLHQEEDEIKLTVSDNGVGLPDDFELRSGKTIGLWIIDVMLKKLDGRISYETKDKGSLFQISFPAEV